MSNDRQEPLELAAFGAGPDAHFRSMADDAPVMMWVTDVEGRCLYLNRPWYEFTGQTPAQAEGFGWLDATHPDDRDEAERVFRQANAARRPFRIDYRLRGVDGVYRWAIDAANPRFGPAGEFLGYVGSVIDIEERREAENRLALSEERLRLAAEAADIGFWDVDVARDRLYWSPRVKRMFGLADDAGVAMRDFYAGLHPDDRDRVVAAYEAACDPARRALYDVEYRTIGPDDGVVRWVAAKGRGVFDADDRCTRVVGTAIDLTDPRRTEAALRESESRYSALFDAIDAGFCVVEVDPGPPGGGRVDYRVVEANPAFYAQTGFAPEVLGRWLREAAPELEEHWFETYGRVASTGEAERFEQGSALLDRWFDVYAFPAASGAGASNRVAILFNDISARRRAEEQLRELNEQLELRVAERTAERDEFWKNSGDLMLVADHDGRMLAVNPAWTEVLGWTREQLIGQPFFDYIHPADLAASEAEAGRLQTTGGPALHFQNRYRRADGGWVWLSWAVSSKDDRFYAVARDVTAEKAQATALDHAREALRQSQKMEAIGSLTGGVAHDFNNLLTPIIGSLDLLQRRGSGDAREHKLIAGALQAAERAKTLVQRLLAFARRQPLQTTAVDVGRLVENMAELISGATGPQIEVVVEMAPDLPPASADPNQIEMALLNLAVNARDAMPDGGELRIAATAEAVTAQHPALSPGRYVRLCVSDTGVGMDEVTLERAVEPFFSTKGVGKGTGLGLSMVHGLASQLGGALLIESRPGVGTDIALWLPVSQTGIDADRPPAEIRPAAGAAGVGMVLLVDDEVAVRTATAGMLDDLGYEVVEAGSADEALALIHEGLNPAMIVTDHLMPGMTGSELARVVRVERPDVPILIISGYASDEGAAREFPSLAKPFRCDDLAGVLAALQPARASTPREPQSGQ